MSLKTDNLRFVLQKTILDLVKDEVDAERAKRVEALVARFHEEGTDRFVVTLPDGESVAAISLVKPKPKLAVNQAELIGWLETNGLGDLVQEVEIPARTEKQLPVDILEKIGATEIEDGTYVTADGVPVDGAKTIYSDPSSVRVAYTNKAEGQQRIIDAWRDGELAGIEPGNTLPEIGA